MVLFLQAHFCGVSFFIYRLAFRPAILSGDPVGLWINVDFLPGGVSDVEFIRLIQVALQ